MDGLNLLPGQNLTPKRALKREGGVTRREMAKVPMAPKYQLLFCPCVFIRPKAGSSLLGVNGHPTDEPFFSKQHN